MATDILTRTAEKLTQTIISAQPDLVSIPENTWAAKPVSGGWSRKEILGHLIDSAANNHIRFIRAQLPGDIFTGPAYEQDHFVAAQKYNDTPATELIELWFAYNRHLAHVIANIDPAKLQVSCHIGSYDPVPFSFVITDYVDHMVHHVDEILKEY
jgi:hypothetical protein